VYEAVIQVERHATTRVSVGAGAIRTLATAWPAGRGRAFVVADRNVLDLHGRTVDAALKGIAREVLAVAIPGGERAKTRAALARLQDALLAARVERSDVVVALGGGVTTDLAGFAAATCLRGLRWVAVPTTLVGMVDAAIGGKTGVDAAAGKNLVGAFHWPERVVADTDFLATLPPEQVRQGLAEMLKHAVVGDADMLDAIEREAHDLAKGDPPSGDLVARAAAVKVAVVSRDPFEQGERRVLNLGHTVGHAIEAATRFATSHGDAVSTGLVVELRVAERRLGFPVAEALRISDLLSFVGLPTRPQCAFRSAARFLQADKKTLAGAVRLALPRRPGEMEKAGGEWAIPVPHDAIEGCWHD
jgi:3-dehydroquinate synthase